jgi:hypothetical protein
VHVMTTPWGALETATLHVVTGPSAAVLALFDAVSGAGTMTVGAAFQLAVTTDRLDTLDERTAHRHLKETRRP